MKATSHHQTTPWLTWYLQGNLRCCSAGVLPSTVSGKGTPILKKKTLKSRSVVRKIVNRFNALTKTSGHVFFFFFFFFLMGPSKWRVFLLVSRSNHRRKKNKNVWPRLDKSNETLLMRLPLASAELQATGILDQVAFQLCFLRGK